jgi:hypothetical protein
MAAPVTHSHNFLAFLARTTVRMIEDGEIFNVETISTIKQWQI